MDNRTRVVQHADIEDVKTLRMEVSVLTQRLAAAERELEALKRKVENSNKLYGTWGGFPPNEQSWLNCQSGGAGKIEFVTLKKETNEQ